ncbi:MAG: hypothetical protein FWF56_04785 [Firmicutes bacterium]|nr:hypothetical protein [Bacillota bacterium]
MDKEIRQYNQVRGLPQNYSNSLRFLDIMYPDPIFKRGNTPHSKNTENTKPIDNQTTNTDKAIIQKQIVNTKESDSNMYLLPNFKSVDNPFSKGNIIFHIIFGLIATIILGFVLTVIFGNYDSFDFIKIIREMFGASIGLLQGIGSFSIRI